MQTRLNTGSPAIFFVGTIINAKGIGRELLNLEGSEGTFERIGALQPVKGTLLLI